VVTADVLCEWHPWTSDDPSPNHWVVCPLSLKVDAARLSCLSVLREGKF